MREFVNGSEQQYAMLRESLNDHRCHVYNCTFPPCFSKASGRIGFEKEGNTYALFIDRGLTCSRRKAPSLLFEWLSAGTLRFLDFTDMKVFLKNLSCLY